jgi:RNA polymerase sigma-70 factor (ECF subfamily)
MSAPAEFAFGLKRREVSDAANAAREGGRQEFDRLVTEHYPAVWRLARRLAADRADAEDLVQETFLKAWKGIAKLRKQASCRGWLFRILVNVWRDRYRRHRPTVALLDPAGSPADPAARLARRDLLTRVLAAVRDLPRRQREALLLRVRGDLSYVEVAMAMGIRKGAVKAHLVQARRKLTARFGEEIDGWT